MLDDVAARFDRVQNPILRTRLATQLFGDEGVRLIPILHAGAGGLAGTDEIGAGAGGRSLLGQAQDFAGKYGPQAQKFAKAYGMAQQSGLLGGQQQRMPMPNPPGGGPQMAGMPSSAQIAFPDAYQPKAPYYPLDEALRKRMQDMGY